MLPALTTHLLLLPLRGICPKHRAGLSGNVSLCCCPVFHPVTTTVELFVSNNLMRLRGFVFNAASAPLLAESRVTPRLLHIPGANRKLQTQNRRHFVRPECRFPIKKASLCFLLRGLLLSGPAASHSGPAQHHLHHLLLLLGN